MFNTRVGVGVVDGFSLGCRRVGVLLTTGATATTGTGSGWDLLSVIGTDSSSNASLGNMVERRIRVYFVGDDFLVDRVRD